MTASFLAKKWLGSLLLPLPLLLFLALFGVFLLLNRHKRSGIIFVSVSLLALMLLSTRPVANALITPLEQTYAPFKADSQPVDDIIVLGAAQVADPRLPLLSQLGNAALARISEGVRLAHAYPDARLIVSGHAGGESRSSAELYAEVAQALGIESARITMLPRPRDTAEEAAAIAPLIKHRRAVLVSSASHLPRAMALFATEGASPLPAPVDHQAKESAGTLPLYSYLPNARYLERSERAWHEYLGRLWMRLRHNE
ncbi:envelope biogenesis factor ElyC [Oceanimonas baumannii]|uniref:envelope biogenesis factor ElyC n=1 Tax=Oceanimonas baumannii TaxID=129578 RepID=UPI001D18690E|nr:envelope biogenesis factor ElyC [Oceanimonas baumannii]MCC4264193.1 envelope biogenesis factor ElyC [Oceanimonas baumannii]